MKRKILLFMSIIFAVWFFVTPAARAEESLSPTFLEEKASRRVRVVEIDTLALAFRRTDFLSIAGEEFFAENIEIEWRNGGDYTVSFRENGTESYSVITSHFGYLAGVIFHGDGAYLLWRKNGEHVLFPFSNQPRWNNFRCSVFSPLEPEFDSVSIAGEPGSLKRKRSVPRPSKEEVVMLIELYTDEALKVSGGDRLALESIIYASVDYMNSALKNSGISTSSEFKFKLAYVGVLEGFKDIDAPLSALSALSLNYRARELRDAYDGDLVGLWVGSYQIGGIAWLMNYPPVHSESAYHIVGPYAFDPAYPEWFGNLLAHEVIHNLGGHHNEEVVAQNPAGSSTPWARGWYDHDGREWRTIMSYNDPCTTCKWIPNYSNPNILYRGIPTGVPDKADNVRMLRLAYPYVVDYR